MMVTKTQTFTKDEKNIVLLPMRGSEEQTITNHITVLQDRKETLVRLFLLGHLNVINKGHLMILYISRGLMFRAFKN